MNRFEVFGNYILLKKLAEGGMAEVFLARPASQMGNGRVQVIKRLLPHMATHSMFLSMFQKEIQMIMGFCHPNTVQLHDFGKTNDQPFIAMEYIEGKNLKELAQRFTQVGNQIPIPMVLSLIVQAAAGLSYAHTFVNKVTGEAAHTIHRDVSPHNLIVSYDGNLKVIDFGIAKATSNLDELTRVGTIKGKIAYLSPEQINGQTLDSRSDVFALGVVAWELLTLQRPFFKDGTDDISVTSAINDCNKLEAPSAHNRFIPPDIDDVILKAIRKDPNERYESARDFQLVLRQVMHSYFPDYSYTDTGSIVKSLFAEDIFKESKELFELNLQAQELLQENDKTEVLQTQSLEPVATKTIVRKKEPTSTKTRRRKRLRRGKTENPFSHLLEDLSIDTRLILKPFDAGNDRLIIRGQVFIYDLTGKIITKARIRNCSFGGVGFETPPSRLKKETQVLVQFAPKTLGSELGLIKCKVKWLNPIEGHYCEHMAGGLQFGKMSKEASKKLKEGLLNYNRSPGFSIGDR